MPSDGPRVGSPSATTAEGLPTLRLDHALDAGVGDPAHGPLRRAEHTALIDQWLRTQWRAAGAPPRGAALAAVGSVGRRDPGPASDLDLVLLLDPELAGSESASGLASALWYPVWDSGTSLDHSVRTPAQCEQVAAEDLRTAVSLLDLRPVAGEERLVADAATRVRRAWRTGARTRIEELGELVEDRTGRYGVLAHSTEPNLKSDRGGLRDVTLIRAIAESWLADHDHVVVDRAADVLLEVRDALQLVTGRASTRLSRADQDAVAGLCGYGQADDLLAALAEASRAVGWQLHRSLAAARSAAARGGRATYGAGAMRRPALQRLDHGVIVQAGEISVDLEDPSPLRDLAAVRHATTTGLPLTGATLARLASGRCPRLRPAQRDLLVDALSGEHLAEVYEALDVHGAVARLVPGWQSIRNRPQRSPVHRYTVDRHQVETVLEAQKLLGTVDRPDLLLVTALLHDLGKTPEAEDHSLVGAPLAHRAATELGFDAADAEVIAALVREHLTLVELATGRDHADPATVDALLNAVDHDPSRLDLLRALTEADARAAGPAAWTTWRAELVEHLAAQARDTLTGVVRPPREMLAPQRSAQVTVLDAVRSTSGCVVLYPAPGEDAPITEICMGAPDGPGVFAALARVLVRLRFQVRSAVVATVDGVAVTTWWVTGRAGDLPHPTTVRTAMERELARREDPAARVLETGPQAPMRRSEDTPVVALLPSAPGRPTPLQINARNRPSLLADIAETITGHRLLVSGAHVMTLGRRAVDVLYLTDLRGRPLDEETAARVAEAVAEAAA